MNLHMTVLKRTTHGMEPLKMGNVYILLPFIPFIYRRNVLQTLVYSCDGLDTDDTGACEGVGSTGDCAAAHTGAPARD
jgi:hypothetical protein